MKLSIYCIVGFSMCCVLCRTLGHMELVEKMRSLIDLVQEYSNYLQMEETALEDVWTYTDTAMA